MKNITENKKAKFDYHIIETYEAGIVLTGSEVKSCCNNHAIINNAYCFIDNNYQLSLIGSHIESFKEAGYFNHNPDRDRILLMHKKEIINLKRAISEKGMTIIPLQLYFNNNGKIKLKIGLCKGKNNIDKRETIKNRENDITLKRLIKK